MIVLYQCQCGHEFDGHWDRFPELEAFEAIQKAMICPKCGNKDDKKNIESDEIYGGDDNDQD